MNGLVIISEPEKLKVLGNKTAFSILNLIRKHEYSAIEIAKILKIKDQLITYHLKNLEKNGLATIVRTENVRNAVKKYFRATAEKFLIITDLDENKDSMEHPISEAFMKDFMNDFKSVICQSIDYIVSECLNIKEDDRVCILFDVNEIEYVKYLILQLRRIGTRFRIRMGGTDFLQQSYSELSLEMIEKSLKQEFEDTMNWANTWIVVGSMRMPDISDIPTERISKINKIRSETAFHLEMDTDSKCLHLNIPLFKHELLSNPNVFERIKCFWRASSIKQDDYSRMKTVADRILEKGHIRIKSGHYSDLTLDVSRTNFLLDAGSFTSVNPEPEGSLFFEIPSGALLLLPIENSLNGDIYCQTVTQKGSEKELNDDISGVILRIEKGIVMDIQTDFSRRQDNVTPELDVKEIIGLPVSLINIGLNSQITNSGLLPELNKQMLGCVCLSFGMNTRLGGKIAVDNPWSLFSHSPDIYISDEIVFRENECLI